MLWGANTDVGKTLVSAGLAAATKRDKVRQQAQTSRGNRD